MNTKSQPPEPLELFLVTGQAKAYSDTVDGIVVAAKNKSQAKKLVNRDGCVMIPPIRYNHIGGGAKGVPRIILKSENAS